MSFQRILRILQLAWTYKILRPINGEIAPCSMRLSFNSNRRRKDKKRYAIREQMA